MRTTIAIDDDVLLATKHEAARRKVSLGEAASDLIRAGLKAGAQRQTKPAATVGPFALLPARDEIVTPEHVRRLMEQEGI
jgi:negative regulator of replication initiation